MRFTRMNSNGDTIIEVLMVLAVLSFAFAIASATSTGSLTRSRNSQEHSQALGTLNSQIELLRKAIDKNDPNLQAAQPFCMNGTTIQLLSTSLDLKNVAAYPAECRTGNYYAQNITYVPANASQPGYYSMAVNWDGSGGLGRQSEKMYYRIQAFGAQNNDIIIPPPVDTRVLEEMLLGSTFNSCDATPLTNCRGGTSPATSGLLVSNGTFHYTLNHAVKIPAASSTKTTVKVYYQQFNGDGVGVPPSFDANGFKTNFKFYVPSRADRGAAVDQYLPYSKTDGQNELSHTFVINRAREAAEELQINWSNDAYVVVPASQTTVWDGTEADASYVCRTYVDNDPSFGNVQENSYCKRGYYGYSAGSATNACGGDYTVIGIGRWNACNRGYSKGTQKIRQTSYTPEKIYDANLQINKIEITYDYDTP